MFEYPVGIFIYIYRIKYLYIIHHQYDTSKEIRKLNIEKSTVCMETYQKCTPHTSVS